MASKYSKWTSGNLIADYGSNYSRSSNNKGVIACNSMTVTVVKSRREVLWAPVLTVLDRAGVALFVAVAVVMDWEWP